MGARTLLKVLVAWSAVLSAAACDVEFIAGPSHVKNGEPVQYQVLVTAAEAATNATVHLAGDVPAGWILDSATFLTSVSGGASGGLTVHPSNPGVITGLPAVPPGHRRIYLSAGPFTTITADDAGTALLDFTAAGAQGSYTMTFWAGVSTQPGEPGESYSKSLSVTPPMPPDAIFTDGFESGTTEGWSLRAGVDPSTVAYLPLDGDAHDESAYGNDGTAIGDPVATANRFDAPGAALLFDGVDDQIIIPDAPSLDLEQAVTLAARIRPAPTGNHYVVGKINLTGSGFLYALDYLLGAASGRFRDAQGAAGQVTGYLPIQPEAWQLLVFTWDGKDMVCYVGGVVEGHFERIDTTIGANDGDVEIGSYEDARYRGAIDEVLIMNRALSFREVARMLP